jgi:protein-tyrosine phosphatase
VIVLDKLLPPHLLRLLSRSGLPRDLVWITPFLAQSGRFETRQATNMAREGIDSVLDLREEEGHDRATLARVGLHYLHLPVTDGEAPSLEQISLAADWVLAETARDRKVLVHCRLGVSRSACLMCAVLLRMGYPLAEAYELVKRSRPSAAFGQRQLEVLQAYQETLRTSSPAP